MPSVQERWVYAILEIDFFSETGICQLETGLNIKQAYFLKYFQIPFETLIGESFLQENFTPEFCFTKFGILPQLRFYDGLKMTIFSESVIFWEVRKWLLSDLKKKNVKAISSFDKVLGNFENL